MSVTIKDIAKSLGVSYSTVSRALNDKPGVSLENRKRIIAEAKRVSYNPNAMARGLVKKHSDTIGVIIPDMANSFFGEVTEGIIESAKTHGYTVFLCVSNWDMKTEKKYLRTLQEKRVDGIILKASKDDKDRNFKDEINVPYTILDGSPIKDSNVVQVDNEYGGYIATKYLIKQGYRNIAFIGGKRESYTNSERVKGYIKALDESGININPNLILYDKFTANGGYNLAKGLLKGDKEIDGIFAGNDVIALGVLDYAATHGYDIPRELGIIGFDNISYAGLPQIQLTTVHQPKFQLGKYALETLLDEISNGKNRVKNEIILNPELIIRKTTR